MRKHVITMVISLLVFAICHTDALAKANVNASSVKVSNVYFHDESVLKALSRLASDYHIVIGVSGISDNVNVVDEKGLSISVPSGTLKDVLDALMKAKPGYKWSEEGDAIEVQIGERLPLLDVPITFDFPKSGSEILATRILTKVRYDLPEVKSWMQQQDCLLGNEQHAMSHLEGRLERPKPDPAFHYKNKRLEYVLSDVARRKGTFFWWLIRDKTSFGACRLNLHVDPTAAADTGMDDMIHSSEHLKAASESQTPH